MEKDELIDYPIKRVIDEQLSTVTATYKVKEVDGDDIGHSRIYDVRNANIEDRLIEAIDRKARLKTHRSSVTKLLVDLGYSHFEISEILDISGRTIDRDIRRELDEEKRKAEES